MHEDAPHLASYVARVMPRSAAPVWAPNPGVPLTARILAYLFAALMLYTVIASYRNVRPPDIPPVPTGWQRYSSAMLHLQISYPQGWIVDDKATAGQTHFSLSLPPAHQVYFEVIGLELPNVITSENLQQLNANLAGNLSEAFPGYLPRADATGEMAEWHQFQARRTKEADSLPMNGAWVCRVHGKRLVYVIALAPSSGWGAMQGIATEVLKGMSF